MTTEKPEANFDQDRDDRIDEAFGEYLACLDAGQPIDKSEFLAKFPDIADSLEKCMEAESTVRNMAGPTFAETDVAILGTVISPVRDPAAKETGTYSQSVDTQTDQKPTDWGIPLEFGRYRVKKLLGQGAMGAVYLAEDTQLNRPVALKIPKFDQQQDPGLLERFYREARAVATIHHPNICPVYDVGEIDGQIFLSMAYIKGRPLSEFARSDKKQSQRSVAKLVMKIAKALKEAHDIGVVHRDLKPANIMVSKKGGEPVVMDFGLARQLDSNEVRVTQSGYIVGTPAYMSPEQVEGASNGVGPLSDQYSLGVVLYELLTGQLPFSGSVLSIIGQIAHKEPTPLAELRVDLDPRLADICNKMMAKDPAHRFENMEVVASALSNFLTESKTAATPDNQSRWEINQAAAALESVVASEQRQPGQAGAWKKGNQSKRKPINRWVLIGGALGLLTVLAGVVIFFQNADGTVRIEITDPKIQVTFADQTFTIDDNGSKIKVTPGKLKLHVEREGLTLDTDELTIKREAEMVLKATWVDGELTVLGDDKKIDSKREAKRKTHTDATPDEWMQLFNGKDLSGWIAKKNPHNWRFENGLLIGEGSNSFLYSNQEFADFHLRITAKLNSNANSGIFFRIDAAKEVLRYPDGYEAQLTTQLDQNIKTGGLFIMKSDEFRAKKQNKTFLLKPNEWVTLEVIAQGKRIQTKVNAQTTLDYIDQEHTYRKGLIALQLQGASHNVLQVKSIEIRNLKANPSNVSENASHD